MSKSKTDRPAPAEPHACECQRYTVEGAGTGCTSTTRGQFAVGHDAKLKSMLIRAGAAGIPVERDGKPADAQTWADNHGFAARVEHGIKLARAKAAMEAEHEAATAALAQEASAATAVEVRAVKIRVGRWEHDAVVAEDGSASYRTNKGVVKVVAAADVHLVDEFEAA